jgi:hypothetical protein
LERLDDFTKHPEQRLMIDALLSAPTMLGCLIFSIMLLVAFYAMLVGFVTYLILAMSDPFEGSLRVEPTPFEHVLEHSQIPSADRRS